MNSGWTRVTENDRTLPQIGEKVLIWDGNPAKEWTVAWLDEGDLWEIDGLGDRFELDFVQAWYRVPNAE